MFQKTLNVLPVRIPNQKLARFFIETYVSSIRNQTTSLEIKRFTVTKLLKTRHY